MKRYSDLFSRIVSLDNLSIAFDKATKHKKWRNNIRKCIEHKEQIIQNIHKNLINKTYYTSQYRTKTIYEPKERLIYILSFAPDRIVHHAIMNVLEPILDKRLIYDTYSCRVGKGQMKASDRCLSYCKKYKYCLQFDISKFYPSINHEILKQILRKIFKDNDLLTLFDEIIDSTHTETNVPIGNYLSQWFGNIYLNELDRFLISQGFSKFIRYCDDFLIFSNDKSELLNLRPKIIEFLDTYLKLKLSKAQVNNCKSQGVTFLGYRHISEPTSRILMKRDTLKRIKTRLKSINKSDINKDIDHYRSQIASAIGWIKHTNYFNLYRDLNLSELAVKVGLFQYDLRVNLMHSFKDIADPKDVLGEKISIKDILNKKIILYDYQTYHKKTEKEERDFVKIIYKEKEDDNYRISFTSSKILRNLLDKYQQSLPFTCKIVKVNNTYRLD